MAPASIDAGIVAVKITPATRADEAVAVALWADSGLTRPWNDANDDFVRAVEGGNSAVLIAYAGEDVLGTVMVGDDGHRGWMYYLAVAEDSRGTGVGAALVHAAEDWLAQRGQRRVRLMVRNENHAVLGFYGALGYVDQECVVLGRTLGE